MGGITIFRADRCLYACGMWYNLRQLRLLEPWLETTGACINNDRNRVACSFTQYEADNLMQLRRLRVALD